MLSTQHLPLRYSVGGAGLHRHKISATLGIQVQILDDVRELEAKAEPVSQPISFQSFFSAAKIKQFGQEISHCARDEIAISLQIINRLYGTVIGVLPHSPTHVLSHPLAHPLDPRPYAVPLCLGQRKKFTQDNVAASHEFILMDVRVSKSTLDLGQSAYIHPTQVVAK